MIARGVSSAPGGGGGGHGGGGGGGHGGGMGGGHGMGGVLGISSRPTMLPTAVMATINAICLPSSATSSSRCRVRGVSVRSRWSAPMLADARDSNG